MGEDITPEEARKIRDRMAKKTNATSRTKAKKVVQAKAKSQVDDFKNFIRTQGVIGLAIGLVLGVQVKAVVDQLVVSFIDPVLGIILPGSGSLIDKTFSLSIGNQVAVFAYGAFISVMVSFITVILIVYFGVKALRLDKLNKKA